MKRSSAFSLHPGNSWTFTDFFSRARHVPSMSKPEVNAKFQNILLCFPSREWVQTCITLSKERIEGILPRGCHPCPHNVSWAVQSSFPVSHTNTSKFHASKLLFASSLQWELPTTLLLWHNVAHSEKQNKTTTNRKDLSKAGETYNQKQLLDF